MSTPARDSSGRSGVALRFDTRLDTAGAFLHNVIRETGVTCRVCTTPVRGFDQCWRCAQMRHVAGVADIVAPLIYAVTGTPSADLLYDYKNHPARGVRDSHGAVITELIGQFLTRHERCLGYAAGVPVSCRLVIPSLTSRPGRHPFTVLLQSMGALSKQVMLLAAPDARCDRAVNEKFVLQPATRLDGQHVLILDDVWTTGSNAQSAALAARRAGAAVVSVVVVGRWLSPNRQLTAEFIAKRLGRPYDPGICPVTGGDCPSPGAHHSPRS